MEELIIQNEWWESGEISKEKAKPYKRRVFSKLKEIYFNYRQIPIITGLRRVGKTVLIYQIIEELLTRVKPTHIIYFSFDTKVENPLEVLKLYQKVTKVNWKKEKIYLFFDEVQKLRDWSSKIKLIYDNLPNIRLCLSGSASIMIEKSAVRDLAGRYYKIDVKPLHLQEYAELFYGKKIKNFELHSSELDAVFKDYIRKPFPELVKVTDKEKITAYIKELVIEKVLGADVPEVYKNVNFGVLSTLSELFLKNTGMILNLDELSKKLHVHKLTLKEHLHYLEFGKLIRVVRNYRPSIMSESRKMPKIYAYHPALSFAFFSELSEGRIYENLVMHAMDLDKYFREKTHEIDFLKVDRQILPIEVKSKSSIETRELKPLLWFMKKFKVKKGMIVYSGDKVRKKIQNHTIDFIPIQELLF